MGERRFAQAGQSDEVDDIGRRSFLRVAGLAGAALVTAPAQLLGPMLSNASAKGPARWSSPVTWATTGMPGPTTVAIIREPVLLDVDATVAGVRIEPGGELIFDPKANRTLQSTGNVENRGRLIMKPGSATVVHRLIFIAVDERRYVGGGMSPVASDVGLWTVDDGVLELLGSPKLAWTRAATGIAAGASAIRLAADPLGWRVGDEIVLTPTISPATPNHFSAYDSATIRAISGRMITLSQATSFPHPAVTLAAGKTSTAEVLNLTRNVRIEGTPSGRAHVFSRSTRPQTVRDAAIRYMGPRQAAGKRKEDVVGRYGLHFHHSHDGSRGSLVQGVVVRDAGSHAFVPHLSHGITLRDCISHNTFETAYWWDAGHDQGPNELFVEGCVASLIKVEHVGKNRVSGFWLGAGLGNVARNCVSVGVEGISNSSGFIWPPESAGVWRFQDCLAHNNRINGIFVWQNTKGVNVVSRFTGYHNGKAGTEHGAYRNSYKYEDCIFYGNLGPAVFLSAASKPDAPLTFVRTICDGAGLPAYAAVAGKHNVEAARATMFSNCTFRGYKKAGLAVGPDVTQSQRYSYDIVDCTFEGNEFWLDAHIPAASVIRVQDARHGTKFLKRKDQQGTYQSNWNARVTSSP